MESNNSDKKTKSKSRVVLLFQIFNILSILLLLVSYSASYIRPEGKLAYIALLGLAYPVFLVFTLFFLLFWLVLWKKYFWLNLVVIILGFNHILTILQFNVKTEKAPRNAIKVMTFNVHNLIGKDSENGDRKMPIKINTFLREERPEILCIQEFVIRRRDSANYIQRFSEELGLKYSHSKEYSDRNYRRMIDAITIFSKYPILHSGHIELPVKQSFCVYADIMVHTKIIRVYNIHLQSIRLGWDDYSFYSNLSEGEGDQASYSKGIYQIVAKLLKAFKKRAIQVETLLDHLKRSPYPVIICGDFNDTPTSYAYNKLINKRVDSFVESGSGFLNPTYAGSLPSFRIDYILHDKAFKSYEYKRYMVDLSDHYPVSTYIDLNNSK